MFNYFLSSDLINNLEVKNKNYSFILVLGYVEIE